MRKFHRNNKLNLWLLQKLRTSQMWIPHHQQLDHHHQLNREVAQEETRALDRVIEHLHIHLRRTQMKIQQPWIYRIAWATVQGHNKNEKAHEDRIHNNKKERRLLLTSNRVTHQRPRSTSLLIQMKTMKNLEMSLEPLQTLNLLYQYFLVTLVMKTVSTATNIVHKVETPKRPCTIQISTFWQMMSIGQRHLRHTSMQQELDQFVFQWLKMDNNRTYAIWSLCRVYNDHCASLERPKTSTT